MKAKFTNKEQHNATQPHNKELTDAWQVVVKTKDGLRNPVTARCYMGRSASASVVYACVWANGKGISVSGKGSAGGYGYCKTSQAVANAIESAGVELFGSPYLGQDTKENAKKRCHIGGTGTQSIETALTAIRRALGYRGALIITRN